MKQLEDDIREIAEAGLKDTSHFLVEVRLSSGKQAKLTVLLDGDQGVSIEDCTALSRYLGNEIEERDLIKGAYTLDVGSPGLDTPLKLKRQFLKNKGRKLKVRLLNGEVYSGLMTEAGEKTLTLEVVKKKEKKTYTFEYEEIDWAKVQVTF